MARADDIEVRVADQVAWVTINRPQRMNALARATFAQLVEVSLELDQDPGVKVVVYTGAGERAFGRRGPQDGLDAAGRMTHPMGGPARNLNEVVLEMATPTIAAINGVDAGGGASWPWPATSAWLRPPRASACRKPGSAWAPISAAWCCPS